MVDCYIEKQSTKFVEVHDSSAIMIHNYNIMLAAIHIKTDQKAQVKVSETRLVI